MLNKRQPGVSPRKTKQASNLRRLPAQTNKTALTSIAWISLMARLYPLFGILPEFKGEPSNLCLVLFLSTSFTNQSKDQ